MKKSDRGLYGAVSYVLLVFSAVLMLIFEGDDDFVKFHSIQSIVFSIVLFVVWIAIRFFELFISLIPFAGFVISLINFLFALAFIIAWVYLMYQALQGRKYPLPLFRDFIEKNFK